MSQASLLPSRRRWAQFRYGVVAPLLVSPPQESGALQHRLKELASRSWSHPLTGESCQFALSTIERWYYQARRQEDPVTAMATRPRSDRGRFPSLPPLAQDRLRTQYREYPMWSTRLHAESLRRWWLDEAALAGTNPASERTVQRFLRRHDLRRRRGPAYRALRSAEAARTRAQLEQREVRSYTVTHAHALWHVDFHHARREVFDDRGQALRPVLIAFIDDHTRVLGHAQWYPCENTEAVVHAFIQAVRRTALPRSVLSDNGKPFVAEEFRDGLGRLGVLHETTQCYAPHQNGKVESLWNSIEGRLMAQLVHQHDLTLHRLNMLTQAWLLRDYLHRRHDGMDQTPSEALAAAPSVGRAAPDEATLRTAFTQRFTRQQRQSDGTVQVGKRRFDVPSAYRHLRQLTLRQARWRPSELFLTDADSDAVLCRLPEWDGAAHAAGVRRALQPLAHGDATEADVAASVPASAEALTTTQPSDPPLPPLVSDWETCLRQTGHPMPYVPLDNRPHTDDASGTPAHNKADVQKGGRS